MTEDTVCNMASMTKAITGTCAMQLVEQGKLDLDVADLDLRARTRPKLQVLEGWDGEASRCCGRAEREITLRHLMTHSSGMVYTLWNADFERYSEGDEASRRSTTASRRPGTQPLMFDPGARWDYGISIDWIGRLVQVVERQVARHLHAGRTSSSRSA